MAPALSVISSGEDIYTGIDRVDLDAGIVFADRNGDPQVDGPEPILLHKVKNQKSILALAVSDSKLYAGTQGGELLVHKNESHYEVPQKLTF